MKKGSRKIVTILVIIAVGYGLFNVAFRVLKAGKRLFFHSSNSRNTYGDTREMNGRKPRYFTFNYGRKWRIKYNVSADAVKRAETILRNMARRKLTDFGLRGDESNLQLRIWHKIYNEIYRMSVSPLKNLVKIFKKIKREHNMNHVQISYLLLRFVQFMKYFRPGGKFDY